MKEEVSATGEPPPQLLCVSVSLSLSEVPTPLLNDGHSAGEEDAPRDEGDEEDGETTQS